MRLHHTLATLLALTVPAAAQVTWTVGGSNGQFSTIQDALAVAGPEDLVPEFDPSTGIEFLSTDSEGDDVICTIRLRCLLKKRTLGQAPQPYWDLEAVLDLRLRRGTWKVLRSREVNHSERGRA